MFPEYCNAANAKLVNVFTLIDLKCGVSVFPIVSTTCTTWQKCRLGLNSMKSAVFSLCHWHVHIHIDTEKVLGVHQLPAPAGHEEWEVRPGIQAIPENDPSGQSQAGYPGQQLPCPQVWPQVFTSCFENVTTVLFYFCNMTSAFC